MSAIAVFMLSYRAVAIALPLIFTLTAYSVLEGCACCLADAAW